MAKHQGLIQVYTSRTPQFNFAPFGLALRASGHGFRTLITCLLPHELMQGAASASELLKPLMVTDYSAVREGGRGELNREKIRASFERAGRAAQNAEFDIVVLQGIFHMVERGIISSKEVLRIMEEKPDKVELVLSGQGAPERIIEKADLVTEMAVTSHRSVQPGGNGENGNGRVRVVTGHGKGKTTYCLGKAMLMSSMQSPAFILQVIKSPSAYGEIMAIERLPHLEIRTMGEGFLDENEGGLSRRHSDAARRAWRHWLKEMYSRKYRMLVLDEVNVATHYGLINWERVREMLFLKPEGISLLLSGRHAHQEIKEAATAVIEMKEIRHPFSRGIKARKGIEF